MPSEMNRYGLRYVGQRFNGARLPLDVLSDLPALRDLIAALAKHEFRTQHADRKRVPRGFDPSITFSLVGIEDGSAVPLFELDHEVAQQTLPDMGTDIQDYVSRAFARIATIFDDSANDKFPDALPTDAIRALTKLGANIQDDERIEFQGSTGADGNVVFLDGYRRRALLTRVRETYTVEVEPVGTLTGVDASHNMIQVQTEQYGEIRLPLYGTGILAEHFDGNIGTEVEFSVSISLDANDQFKGIEEIHSVDLIIPYREEISRCVGRIQELAKLERGWLGEDQGEQVVHIAGTRATQLVFMRGQIAKLFKIFPTEDGGVSIEFGKGDWSFGVEILPDGSIEIDASGPNDESFDVKAFPEISVKFLEAFDAMIKGGLND